MRINLEHYGGPTWTIAITPPGQDRLPYACDRDHDHRKAGCQVRAALADEWAEDLAANWKALRDDARLATLRATGCKPNLLLKVVEPQKRGVPHLHVTLGMASEAEKIAARRFRDELERRAPAHGFGFVQRQRKLQGAKETSRYLVGYLLGRNSKRKGTIRENIAHPRMPRVLVWVSPSLTRVTRATMRNLRLARWFVACLQGRCLRGPALSGQLLVDVARLSLRIYRRAGTADEEGPLGEEFRRAQALRIIRRGEPRWRWLHYPEPRPARLAA